MCHRYGGLRPNSRFDRALRIVRTPSNFWFGSGIPPRTPTERWVAPHYDAHPKISLTLLTIDRCVLFLGELADKFAAHATIEETLFYPAVMAKQTEDMLLAWRLQRLWE